MNLSRHFTLEEMTASQTAARRRIDNTPSPSSMINLQRLAQVLEMVRYLMTKNSGPSYPLLISSGYRSPQLNVIVGGAVDSAHIIGCAADFTCPLFGSPLEVAHEISDSPVMQHVDQLIHEYGKWVHLAIARDGVMPRQQRLTIGHDTNGYRSGLLLVA